MITPIEIQSKTFKSGGLGYDKRDVDGFMKDVLSSYETLYRENMELNDKISVLTEGIQYYKTIEKTLQKALVLAEKTAEDTKAAALKNAKNIENEALTKAQLIVADAKNELEHVHNQTIQIIQQYEKYKAQFKSLAAAQIDLLESDSFSINVARLDAFIPTAEATTDNVEVAFNVPEKQADSTYKKKVKSHYNGKHKHFNGKMNPKNELDVSLEANDDMIRNKEFENNEFDILEEVSVAAESDHLKEASELDGFDFIDLKD